MLLFFIGLGLGSIIGFLIGRWTKKQSAVKPSKPISFDELMRQASQMPMGKDSDLAAEIDADIEQQIKAIE